MDDEILDYIETPKLANTPVGIDEILTARLGEFAQRRLDRLAEAEGNSDE